MRVRPSLAVAGVLIGIYIGVFLFLGTRLPLPARRARAPHAFSADIPIPDRIHCGIRIPAVSMPEVQSAHGSHEDVVRDLFRFGFQSAPRNVPSARNPIPRDRGAGDESDGGRSVPSGRERPASKGWRLIGIVDSGGVLVGVWTNGEQTVWRSVGESLAPGMTCMALYPQMATVRLPDGTIQVVRIGEWIPE